MVAPPGLVRSFLVLLGLVAVAAVAAIRMLPSGDAHATTVVARADEIQSISIDGEDLPVAQLRQRLATRIGDTLDAVRLDRDRAALEGYLVSRGYLAAKVAQPSVTLGAQGGAFIVFEVDRGALYHLGEVTLEGGDWKHAGVVTLLAGDEADADRLARARQQAQETLARYGKQLRVDLELSPRPNVALVDVKLVTR